MIVRLYILLLVFLCAHMSQGQSVVDTKHNLSVSGMGGIRAAAETEVCIFCHTPHNADVSAPLWNRFSSGAVYTPYNSSTVKAAIGQPTGSSKLCLSCHDGTMALGMVRSRSSSIAMSGGVSVLPPGTSRIGTDLSDDHPISFRYDASLATANGELRDPAGLHTALKLDAKGEMQCMTCHDPHNDTFGDFLVMDNTASLLCVACHDKTGWKDSSHNLSGASWNGQGVDPWPNSSDATVAANACANCHQPHNAEGREGLLTHALEEENCLKCHNGNVSGFDILADLGKVSVHPVRATTGVHDPAEDLVNAPRHVECADCHNPHAARAGAATAPDARGAQAGVAGISASGSVVEPLRFEYELCFRCHGDSAKSGVEHVKRLVPQTNTRLEFSPANASYHPVVAAGRNPDVPSLIGGRTVNSQIYCTECHSSDTGTQAGGTGANGPHGSAFSPLLERQLVTTDSQGESAANYALCYKCHDRASILANESFSEHFRHLTFAGAACTTCHDPHGSSQNTHLINFNTDYVTPANGVIRYEDTGRFRGQCTLTCHGKTHDPMIYPRGGP